MIVNDITRRNVSVCFEIALVVTTYILQGLSSKTHWKSKTKNWMHQYTVEIFYFHIKSGLHFRVKRLESTVLQKAKQCLNIIRHDMRYDSTCVHVTMVINGQKNCIIPKCFQFFNEQKTANKWRLFQASSI